jgi:NAD+ kinase
MPQPPSLSAHVGIVYNPDKERAPIEYQRLKRWLTKQGVVCTGSTRVTASMKGSRFIVALGGDGTVLRVARETAGWSVPVLGVNVGRLGFLAATEAASMLRILSQILAGRGRVETRTMLSISGHSREKKIGPYRALNDCVIRSGSVGRVLWLQASLHGRLLAAYSGDGVILSTPTGSTAYNLAASGPIVHPDLDVLLLAPICPHSLAQRPLVFPAYEIVTVEVKKPSAGAVLSLDGQVNLPLWAGDRIEIKRAVEQAQLLMDPARSYYDVLHSKLKWGNS